MELVTLQFPTVKELWNFRLAIDADVFEINLRDRKLTCQCDDQHIKLAIEKYGAKLIDTDPQRVQPKQVPENVTRMTYYLCAIDFLFTLTAGS